MKSEYKKLTVDVGSALWSAHLDQVCPIGIAPFSVMDQTDRSGP